MRIAILSDIHDNSDNLAKVLPRIQDQDVMICCGDLCSPFTVLQMAKGFARDIHIVLGNNDGDTFRMAQLANRFPHVHLHGEYAELSLDGRSFAINHFDNIGRALAKGNTFDVVCFGHNHQYETQRIGRTRLINPGEIHGLRSGKATFACYDTQNDHVHRVDL